MRSRARLLQWTGPPHLDGTTVDELLPILRSGRVAIVLEGDTFFGIITQIDLINYLRNQLP